MLPVSSEVEAQDAVNHDIKNTIVSRLKKIIWPKMSEVSRLRILNLEYGSEGQIPIRKELE